MGEFLRGYSIFVNEYSESGCRLFIDLLDEKFVSLSFDSSCSREVDFELSFCLTEGQSKL